MGKQFPKNVRQIGNVNDTPKVYVEDYVDSFFRQMCEQAGEEPEGALLIGYDKRQEDQDWVCISGAVQLEKVEREGTRPVISDDVWKQAEKDAEAYFPGGQIVGWFLVLPGQPLRADGTVNRIHEKHFTADHTICVMREQQGGEEIYFAYKSKELTELGGHYIYYEKNPNMQDYIIESRKKAGIAGSEQAEDKAAERFRDIVRERQDTRAGKKQARATYAMCLCLVLLVLIAGVTMQKQTDHYKNGERKADSSVDRAEDTLPTSGNVTVSENAGEEEPTPEEPAEKKEPETPAEKEEPGMQKETQGAASTMKEMSEDIYIVEKGDTLDQISRKVYGDTGHVDAICRMNGLSDGNLIFIGQKLLLP